MATDQRIRGATAELLGALSYALLHSFQAGARAVTAAPSLRLAEQQAAFAAEEIERYRVLRARLAELTPDPEGAMAAFRPALDAFYEAARADAWLEAQTFQFVGDTMTTDFAELLAAKLDQETAVAVRRALTGRTQQEAFSLMQIQAALAEEGAAAQERVARFAGTMVGAAMNRLREALFASDGLEVVLGEGGVKDVVLEMLGRHRERLERLGVERVDE